MIYLASQSPRRRELLQRIGIQFEVLALLEAEVDESPWSNEDPVVYVQRVCHAKAQAGWAVLHQRGLPLHPVLAADTTVTLNGRIFGKPIDDEDASHILRSLSGSTHQVLTAIAVAVDGHIESRLSTTDITFARLDDERIRRFIDSGEAHDKAGAYGIQGHAGAFVQRIEGSYSGVVGLPLFETVELLKSCGYPVP